MYARWVLTALLAWPAVAAVAILIAPPRWAKHLGFVASVIEFAIAVPLWWTFVPSGWMQFVCDAPWIQVPLLGTGAPWSIHYTVGVDGISLFMVLLTTLLVPLSVVGSYSYITTRERAYYALLLVLTSGMIGVFVALDLFLFYVMWEVMLIPMYFIIGVWGGDSRLYAAIKFFIYTMFGSLLMLVAILALVYLVGQRTGIFSFDYFHLMRNLGDLGPLAFWLFAGFFLAFAIKVPMFPFHTWLPDAHVEAPTAGSVILAGILLKLGTYSFYRFNLPMFPKASADESFFFAGTGHQFGVRSVMIFLAIVSIIYGALAAMYFVVKRDGDVKKLVAYSSVSSMGIVMLGLFSLNPNGINGGVMQMVNHGIYSGALFLLVGIIYERRHTRNVAEFGGLSHVMPGYAAVFLAMAMTAIGLPMLAVFISEFLAMRGAFEANPVWAGWAGLGIILNAGYMLWLYQRMFFGEIENEKKKLLPDLSGREWAYMLPLVIMSLWIGIYPGPFLRYIEKPVNAIVKPIRPNYQIPGQPTTTSAPVQIR